MTDVKNIARLFSRRGRGRVAAARAPRLAWESGGWRFAQRCAAWTIGIVGVACSPCASLERDLCEALAGDCALWREIDRPGLPTGRRAFRACAGASIGSQHDLALQAARASIAAIKRARGSARP
ncbi:MAG: hypothetical protein AAF721_16520 [Myxococcota bacterium]